MDKVEILIPVSVIVDAIVAFYDGDVAKVLAFYEAAYAKLNGVNPEIDAILNGIDNWLIPHTFNLPQDEDGDEEWGEYVPCLSQ